MKINDNHIFLDYIIILSMRNDERK